MSTATNTTRATYLECSPYFMALECKYGRRIKMADAGQVARIHGTTLKDLMDDGLTFNPAHSAAATCTVLDLVMTLGY